MFSIASNAQTEVSEETIQRAADALKPALCQNDLLKAIEIAQDCYETTQNADLNKVNQCILEDFTISGLAEMKRTKAEKNGLPDPYAGIEFVDPDNLQIRLIKYRNYYSYGNKASEIMSRKLYNDTMRVALDLYEEDCFDSDIIH